MFSVVGLLWCYAIWFVFVVIILWAGAYCMWWVCGFCLLEFYVTVVVLLICLIVVCLRLVVGSVYC